MQAANEIDSTQHCENMQEMKEDITGMNKNEKH